jgi:hypothetical protein
LVNTIDPRVMRDARRQLEAAARALKKIEKMHPDTKAVLGQTAYVGAMANLYAAEARLK